MRIPHNILIIDDELGPREALRMILKEQYSVTTAESAKEGLEMISEEPHFDVVILDIKMPEMDGISALKEIKKMNVDAEVVMVTAYASLETARQAIQFGALDYLIKPFDHKDVLNIVEKGIEKRGTAIEQKQKQLSLENLVREQTKDLKITGQLLRTLYENANDGIILTNKNGMIIDANHQASHMLGYADSQLLGINIENLEVEANKPLFRERLSRLLNGESLIFETKQYCRDGSTIDVEVSSKAITVDDNLIIQSIHRDISEKKKLLAQLLYSQKMESIGILAGGIAHDFNNILTLIMGNTQLLLLNDKENVPPEVHEKLKLIESSTKIGASLASKLLNFARRGQLMISSFDINAAFEETIEMFSRLLSNIEIIKVFDDSLPFVEADRGKIDQSIVNSDMPPFAKEGIYIYFSISDTGMGIPEENMHNIFEPFYTTKAEGKGTGLGLFMIYDILKEHGGYITASSAIGKGSTFTVYLPLTSTLNKSA
jgi:PAS domain S-box-containing protein